MVWENPDKTKMEMYNRAKLRQLILWKLILMPFSVVVRGYLVFPFKCGNVKVPD